MECDTVPALRPRVGYDGEADRWTRRRGGLCGQLVVQTTEPSDLLEWASASPDTTWAAADLALTKAKP